MPQAFEAEYLARKIGPGIAGIPAKLVYGPTLEAALKLHPGTRRVVVICDNSKTGTETMADVRRDFLTFESTVEFRYLIDVPMADLRREVSLLSGDTVIIYLGILQDGTGTSFIPRDALKQISETAQVPIYGYYDSYLGHGTVGGVMLSFEIEASNASNAAHLGLRILAGEKPEALLAEKSTSCAYMFDGRQLKRWGIEEEDLPPGSVIRLREPTFWPARPGNGELERFDSQNITSS
jgi:hypothetical protein